MAAASAPAPFVNDAAPMALDVPDSMTQVVKLTRYQLREYLRSRRFVILIGIVLAIDAILTGLVGYYRPGFLSDVKAFYGSAWAGAAGIVIVLAAIFFAGDAIAGEFQNKTGYFLMGLPIRRATVYVGKFIAAYLASAAVLLVYLVVIAANGVYYFGASAFPWQLGFSLVLALIYLAAVLGTTFLFSSLFKVSAYGIVLTAILFLFGFSLLETVISDLVKVEPWMVISYASPIIGNVFSDSVSWGITGQATVISTGRGPGAIHLTVYSPGIAEGLVIMLAYFLLTAVVGLLLFEREEFT